MADLLTKDNPVFSGYVFWSLILMLKMLCLYFLTVRQRFRKKVFISPEDLFFVRGGGGEVRNDDDDVERVRRAHRNDLENIPLFLVAGLFYVLTDPSPDVALNLFRVYAVARILHTLVYSRLRGVPRQTTCEGDPVLRGTHRHPRHSAAILGDLPPCVGSPVIRTMFPH
uniref:Microsomal glutathione S-transferase 1 n=1 Tax=Timema genevievae TaxID=629358 RepID=A0A7R9JST9_TIMGE|nr:unnamed protein product [Timema genevievae]